MPQTDLKGAVEATEKARRHIELMKVPNLNKPGEFVQVTSSFGVLEVRADSIALKNAHFEPSVFIEIGDRNLYQAKKNGRNRITSSSWEPPT